MCFEVIREEYHGFYDLAILRASDTMFGTYCMIIRVHVKAKSRHPEVVERGPSMVDVYVSAAPKDGEANAEMLELLSDYFEVAKTLIEIKKGHASHMKVVEIPV